MTVFAITVVMGGLQPHKTVMCVDETTYSTQSNNHLCAAQGIWDKRAGEGMRGEERG